MSRRFTPSDAESEMTYTMLLQTDAGPWIVTSRLHHSQPYERLLARLGFLERGAREPDAARHVADVVREGDTLSYSRLLFRPCTKTWRILSDADLAVAQANGATVLYEEESQ